VEHEWGETGTISPLSCSRVRGRKRDKTYKEIYGMIRQGSGDPWILGVSGAIGETGESARALKKELKKIRHCTSGSFQHTVYREQQPLRLVIWGRPSEKKEQGKRKAPRKGGKFGFQEDERCLQITVGQSRSVKRAKTAREKGERDERRAL